MGSDTVADSPGKSQISFIPKYVSSAMPDFFYKASLMENSTYHIPENVFLTFNNWKWKINELQTFKKRKQEFWMRTDKSLPVSLYYCNKISAWMHITLK